MDRHPHDGDVHSQFLLTLAQRSFAVRNAAVRRVAIGAQRERGNSEPSHVELNASQIKRLRSAIAVLRTSPGGLCVEDSTLYTISVAPTAHGKAFWSTTADECPGQLTITFDGRQVSLNARSCQLENLIGSFFPSHTATGTKLALKMCDPSE